MKEENLQTNSDFTYEQFGPAVGGEQLPVVLPTGTVFVSAVNGLAGNVTISGGSTGITFTGAGATITMGGALAVANGGTGATTAANARTSLGLGTMAVEDAVAAVADLNQTISAAPTQAEVQAISDKVDELLAAMRTAGHLTP